MYQKVLVPLDGSKLAECALPHVISLAQDGAAGEVILLTVAVINIPYGNYREHFDFIAYRNDQLDNIQRYLDNVRSRLAAENIRVETMVIESGNPAQTITDYAQANGVELIVIATHGYTGIKRMLVGSVALKVLHESHMPVLLIRPETA